jgi:TfoX/Sxy family transcriptional regulator of competence genes
MATDADYMAYVLDQCSAAGVVTSKKMFGEYAIYLNAKVVALACDNQLFVKPTPGGKALLGQVEEVQPYPNAKPHFLITDQLDNRSLMAQLFQITVREVTATPKKPARK